MAEEQGNPVSEVVDLVKTYAIQEIVDPLKPLGKFLAFGVAGAILIGLGIMLLSLALLRGLQTVGALDGNWSIIPYLIVSLIILGLTGLLGMRITKGV